MSATVDSDKFSTYFTHCPILRISGRSYPVEVSPLQPACVNSNLVPIRKDPADGPEAETEESLGAASLEGRAGLGVRWLLPSLGRVCWNTPQTPPSRAEPGGCWAVRSPSSLTLRFRGARSFLAACSSSVLTCRKYTPCVTCPETSRDRCVVTSEVLHSQIIQKKCFT